MHLGLTTISACSEKHGALYLLAPRQKTSCSGGIKTVIEDLFMVFSSGVRLRCISDSHRPPSEAAKVRQWPGS